MRRSLICAALFVVTLSLHFIGVSESRAGERWRKVRIDVPDKASLHRLIQMGVDFEGARGKVGGPVECVVSEDILSRLRSGGIASEVVIEDLAAYYASRLYPGPVNALGFGYGSMGGYYTLSEIRQQLDSLQLLYPGIVGKRDSIGVSLQGRPIWAVRMTSNPDVPSGRPQVLYFAMQHAREPIGMMTLLYTMWHLAERYGHDPEATYLLDNRELWFVPILNVDGYEANRRMQWWGGGVRRKNMRNVVSDGDGNGIDLNRNWDAGWGTGDSSPNPLSEVYCGTAPFSEPETQVLRDFTLANTFRFVMEYHAYGLQVYSPDPVLLGPDTLLFQSYLLELTHNNHYIPWGETGSSGMAREWLHNYKPTVGPTFSFLTEVGNDQDGFWPATSRIFPLVSENLPGNLFAAWAAGAFPKLHTHTVLDSSGDGDLEPGERFLLELRLRNFGQDPATAFSVSAMSDTPLLEIPGTPFVVGSLGAHGDTTIMLAGRVLPTAPGWARGNIVVTVNPAGQVAFRDTVGCIIGKSNILLADGAEDGTTNWNMGGWGRSATAHTGGWSFTDSPAGLYPDNTVSTMTLVTPILIPPVIEAARLRFSTKWRAETFYDYGQVLVSTNQGSSWTVMPGEHTCQYVYNGYTGAGPEWCDEDLDITALAGQSVLLRFRFFSDVLINYDGWYVDDISIRSYSIPGLAYAHDVHLIRQGTDTMCITARVENPLAHTVNVVGILRNGSGGLIDSVFLKDDGLHADSTAGDGLWGYQYVPAKDDTIRVTIRTDDITAGVSRTLTNVAEVIFTHKPLISVNTERVSLPSIYHALSRFDTTFQVSNRGGAEDSIYVSLDPVVTPDSAIAVSPMVFTLPMGASQTVTFSVMPKWLSKGIVYNAVVSIDSRFGYGQTHFEKTFAFGITPVSDEPALPTTFALNQNYPNPFNPTTVISYQLPVASDVRLIVYDLLGREVAVLVNEKKAPGSYQVRFDASGLSSGVYFYRLQSGDFVQTRSLTVLR